MTLFSTPTFVGPATPQDQPARQVVSALSHITGNPLSDNAVRVGEITPDAIQEAIDRAYHGLMRVSTDAERRHWCDRLKFWIARVKG